MIAGARLNVEHALISSFHMNNLAKRSVRVTVTTEFFAAMSLFVQFALGLMYFDVQKFPLTVTPSGPGKSVSVSRCHSNHIYPSLL